MTDKSSLIFISLNAHRFFDFFTTASFSRCIPVTLDPTSTDSLSLLDFFTLDLSPHHVELVCSWR